MHNRWRYSDFVVTAQQFMQSIQIHTLQKFTIEKTYADVRGESSDFKHWGWLDPAGGLLTTLDDLGQVLF